jgi:hypothetical protein
VNHQGIPYKRFSPKTSPLDMKDDIELLCKKKEEDKELHTRVVG